MADDENVDPRNPPREDQLPLDVRVGVPRKQRGERADPRQKDDPRAVRIVAPSARRKERAQFRVAAERPPAVLDRFDRHAAGRRLGAQRGQRRVVERERRDGHRADVEGREDLGPAP